MLSILIDSDWEPTSDFHPVFSGLGWAAEKPVVSMSKKIVAGAKYS